MRYFSKAKLSACNATEMDMNKWWESVVNFLKEEDGPTAVEYAVMLALIVATCLAMLQGVDTSTVSEVNDPATNLGG